MPTAAPVRSTDHIADLDRWAPTQNSFVRVLPYDNHVPQRYPLIKRTPAPKITVEIEEDED